MVSRLCSSWPETSSPAQGGVQQLGWRAAREVLQTSAQHLAALPPPSCCSQAGKVSPHLLGRPARRLRQPWQHWLPCRHLETPQHQWAQARRRHRRCRGHCCRRPCAPAAPAVLAVVPHLCSGAAAVRRPQLSWMLARRQRRLRRSWKRPPCSGRCRRRRLLGRRLRWRFCPAGTHSPTTLHIEADALFRQLMPPGIPSLRQVGSLNTPSAPVCCSSARLLHCMAAALAAAAGGRQPPRRCTSKQRAGYRIRRPLHMCCKGCHRAGVQAEGAEGLCKESGRALSAINQSNGCRTQALLRAWIAQKEAGFQRCMRPAA